MKKSAGIILFLILANLMLLAVAACGGDNGASGSAVTVTGTSAQVKMQNISFVPNNLTVDKGTTVTWNNEDSTAHTVTASDGSFVSGNVSPGQNFGYTFNQTGTFEYSCTIHPTMKGKITVK